MGSRTPEISYCNTSLDEWLSQGLPALPALLRFLIGCGEAKDEELSRDKWSDSLVALQNFALLGGAFLQALCALETNELIALARSLVRALKSGSNSATGDVFSNKQM
jgi:hypothetical protein